MIKSTDQNTSNSINFVDPALEAEFQQKCKESRLSYLSIISVAVVAAIELIFHLNGIGIIICIALSIICFIIIRSYKRKLDNFFSEKVVKICFERMFDNVMYINDQHISRDTIISTGLFSRQECDEVTGDDYARGSYKGVEFEQSDVHIVRIETTVDSKGHAHQQRITEFKGRWMIFDFNKDFVTDIMVRENVGGKLGKFFGRKSNVEFESVEFNNKFTVIAQDAHNAFYIITPQMMEYILSCEQKYQGRFYMCFQNGKVHVALHNNTDSFEISPFGKKTLEGLQYNVMADMSLITGLIDELSLDEKIFKN